MGMLLLVVGLFWAGIGILNFANTPLDSDLAVGMFTVFNFVLFILPGLMVAGLGSLLRKRGQS